MSRLASHTLVLLLGALLIAAGLAAPARALAPAALAAQVQQRYATIQALRAEYQRTSRFMPVAGQPASIVQGAGVLTWARPTSLRLAQSQPKEELVVAGPQGVWWVRPARAKADLYALENFTSGLRALLDVLGGLAKVEESFKLEAPGPDDAQPQGQGEVLVLTPLKTRADLKRLVVWFSPGQLVLSGFRFTSLVGDVTEYRFTQVKVNPSLGEDAFAYTPPEAYRVSDHRPQGGGRP